MKEHHKGRYLCKTQSQAHDRQPLKDEQLYEIKIGGWLDKNWSAWFEGLSITTTEDGFTVLRGHLPDQAALYGVLAKISDLNLELILVNQVGNGKDNVKI